MTVDSLSDERRDDADRDAPLICQCGGSVTWHSYEHGTNHPYADCSKCALVWEDPVACGLCGRIIERSQALGKYGYCGKDCEAEEVG